MKRLSLIVVAIFTLGGVALANEGDQPKRNFDPKVHAEKMTERMVKEYDLNETQKQQLLEVNQAFAEKMGERPMGHRHGKKGHPAKVTDAKKGGKDVGVNKGNREKKQGDVARADRDGKRNRTEAPKLSAEQREKLRAEMKQSREAYNAQLQKIMNADQYQAYAKKQAERDQKRQERGEKSKENRGEKKSAVQKTSQNG
ncbi:MAG: DUF4890 domain-containing protein [Bacteroides sp.]|nr:DUF4890 domain-containing protein [Bacteroides sp.]